VRDVIERITRVHNERGVLHDFSIRKRVVVRQDDGDVIVEAVEYL
jgi:hypothetical protein